MAKPPLSEVLSLYDMEAVAKHVMTETARGYYFTGERDEYTQTANVQVPIPLDVQLLSQLTLFTELVSFVHQAYRMVKLVPRVMIDVSTVDTATTLLGYKSAFPLYISAAAKGGLSMCKVPFPCNSRSCL